MTGENLNRRLWDRWAAAHARDPAGFYGLDAFRNGATTLNDIERAELTDVAGRSLLHLQCHIGLDTLSWAREGAVVTGLDFSSEAIAVARGLSAELGIPASFVEAAIGDDAALGGEMFDIVFTSWGVIGWLGDLDLWAAFIARHLAPGGRFYMAEFHPLLDALDDAGQTLARPWLASGAIEETYTCSYAGAAHAPLASREYAHSLGDVVTALSGAGLRIVYLHEFPYSPYGCHPCLEQSGPGMFKRRDAAADAPLSWSVLAVRDR